MHAWCGQASKISDLVCKVYPTEDWASGLETGFRMWSQNYTPVAGSLGWSAAAAAFPVVALLYAIGVRRVAAWMAGLVGLAAAAIVALVVYRMPAELVASATLYGAAFGVFPIFWVIFWALVLYRITVDTGQFEILRESIGH